MKLKELLREMIRKDIQVSSSWVAVCLKGKNGNLMVCDNVPSIVYQTLSCEFLELTVIDLIAIGPNDFVIFVG